MTSDRDEQIRKRAHAIWEKEGRPSGAHDKHWQQAESEIAKAAKKPPAASAKPKAAVKPKAAAKPKVAAKPKPAKTPAKPKK
jgi:hypothetical protein